MGYVSTTIYIREDQKQKLRELNTRTKVPISEYVRQGIELMLEEHRESGALDDLPEGSENADKDKDS